MDASASGCLIFLNGLDPSAIEMNRTMCLDRTLTDCAGYGLRGDTRNKADETMYWHSYAVSVFMPNAITRQLLAFIFYCTAS